MPQFSDTHYATIALAMKRACPRATGHGDLDALVAWSACCIALSAAFMSDNPKFDKVRFLDACNPPKELAK